jgi:putative PEP-CTERM system histidine kinase
MIDAIGVWSHAACALLYAALAIWQVRRPQGGIQRRTLALAFGITAAWALAIMLAGPHGMVARIAESGRNLGWLGFMIVLLWRARGGEGRAVIVALYMVIGTIIVAQTAVDALPSAFPHSPRILEAFFFAVILLRMTVAIGALVLVHNLYTAVAPQARWGIRPPMIALAAMWTYDLNLYTIAYLSNLLPVELLAARGVLMLMLVPLFALASRRNAKWKLRVSRAVTFQSLSLMAIGAYLVAMVIVARLLQLVGGGFAPLAQVTAVFAMSILALLILPSRSMKAWVRVKLTKHFFQHRYDYRVEWLRFTDTLGMAGEDAAPLDERIVQAVADITESPGGLLLLPSETGGLAAGARWNWPTIDVPPQAANLALVRYLEETGRIIEFDPLRSPRHDKRAAEAELMPEWIIACTRAWAAVPLVHFGRLIGVVLLERPRIDRELDWEDFDLLRVAGRQVASYLAEARGQEALSDAKRFDEFNRRFAFVIHDIKNLVSQLSLVARNAERHADKPEFRADMVATLQSSVGKMNDLLARLSQHNKARPEEPRPVPLRALVEGVARGRPAVRLGGREDVTAEADPVRLEQALAHLVQNAIDASPAGEPVLLGVGRRGIEAVIEVIDHGTGMSAEFIRTRLFKPFASTKEGGFGIGAFEARSLVAAMGGRIEVESREGQGSRFAVILPLALGQKYGEAA